MWDLTGITCASRGKIQEESSLQLLHHLKVVERMCMTSQVKSNLIYIAPYHKIQICLRGVFRVPFVLKPQNQIWEKNPAKNSL